MVKKELQIGPRAFRTWLPTKILQKIGPGAFRPQFWTVLAAFLALFGGSWALSGVCGPLLGVSWAHLGRLWVALGRLLAGLGRHLRSWERSGVDFEGLWDGPGIDFEAPGAYFSVFFWMYASLHLHIALQTA